MVNFGGHLRVIRAEEATRGDGELFLVPYNIIKELIFENDGIEFEAQWRKALDRASEDTQRATQELWQSIFGQVQERGVLLGRALELLVQNAEEDQCRQALSFMGRIHARSITNCEALRKLVKKFDKRYPDSHLSTALLPLLYSSPVFFGQAMLENSVETLRALLDDKDKVAADEDDEDNFLPMRRMDSETVHRKGVEARSDELVWLRQVVSSIPESILGRLVAHRGFHHIEDRNDKRPLENSLSAYEIAWTCGIHLCECDIALTKDEKIVLAHDEDFQRLALESGSDKAAKRVSDLTFRELLSMPLVSGIRPPLLIDVLRSAHAISETSKLIIEIKPGNPTAASALARLLLRHEDLADCVAMIMSFDSVIMHRLHAELNGSSLGMPKTFSSTVSLNGQLTSNHRRYASFDHFGTMGNLTPKSSFSVSSREELIGLDLNGSANDLVPSQLEFGEQVNGTSNPYPSEHNSGPPLKPRPKLMLLTVSDEPKHPCEMQVGVDNLAPAESWLKTGDGGSLDGVYLQFQKSMKTPEGAAALQEFSQRHLVGIWGYSGKDPDDFETFNFLVQEGNVSFVNTDLPGHFRKGVFKRSGTL